MPKDNIVWHGPYSLSDSKKISAIPKYASGILVVSASGVSTKPRQDVHSIRGNIQTELQAYMRDAKGQPPQFTHGIMAEFRWAESPKSPKEH
jgi:hypothetical protein